MVDRSIFGARSRLFVGNECQAIFFSRNVKTQLEKPRSRCAQRMPRVTRDDKEIVTAVLQALLGKVGQERYELWFGQGVELRIVERSLTVATADNFKLERIRRGFRSEIISAAAEVLGFEPTFEMQCDRSLAPPTAATSTPKSRNRSKQQPSTDVHEMPLFATADASTTSPLPLAATSSHATAVVPTPSVDPQHSDHAPTSSNQASSGQPRLQRRQFASLDTFVVGDCNRMAHASAGSVVTRPGTFSPLLLHGPSGCGKTHLLEGIWCQAKRSGALKRVIYLSAEQFTTQFVEALRGTGLPNFRRKYRDVEMLLIDDVHFFSGKQSTLVELLHTIDTLVRDGRQIVLSADRPPNELRGLGPEIVARLSGGLTCGIEAADYATRLQILQNMAARQSLTIAPSCLGWLAGQLDGDARQLAGALNRLQAASEAFGRTISTDFAQLALTDLLRTSRKAVRLNDIVEAVSEIFGVEADQLQSGGKSPAVSHPRMLAMFLARKYTRSALSEIGRYFGRRSHTTVLSANDKVEQWLTEGKQMPLAHGSCSVEDALRRVESHLRLA
jgi:chromosomal replication initiator protein